MRLCFAILIWLAGPSGTALAADPLHVEFVTAVEGIIYLDIELSGDIEAVDSVDLGFRQGGRVIEVLVEAGDRVVAGQALGRLDSVQQDQQLRVAEAGLDAARAAEAQARQASERATAMLDRGVGTRAASDEAEQVLSTAEGALRRAEIAVETARRAVEDMVLRAPQDGVVTSRDMTPGQIVGAAQSVLSLSGLSGLEAVFHAPDHRLLNQAMGADLRLETIDIDRPPMRGRITDIAPLVDPRAGTVTVKARIEPVEEEAALLGAAVRGYLSLADGRGLKLPWTTLTRQGDEPAVWVVEDDGTVRLNTVHIAHFDNGVVWLWDGVTEGQTVVGAGSQLLYPGREVISVEPAEAQDSLPEVAP